MPVGVYWKMPRKPLHPSFRKKYVMKLDCRFCGSCLCLRGMKAILLADNSVELFSTDEPASRYTALVNDPVVTGKCRCVIKDVACLTCGNIVGYAVIIPCRPCLEACNNGHYFMFNSNAVYATERLDHTGADILLWGDLPTVDDETDDKSSVDATVIDDAKYFR